MLPFAHDFLQDFERKHCYDRYWDPGMRVGAHAEPANSAAYSMTTRVMCSGYGFVMIGKDEPGYYTNASNGALARFRRQYFLMGLLAHFHRSALLLYANALAEATAKFTQDPAKPLGDEANLVLSRFLAFTQCHWFREISDQLPAQQLFSLWSKHLGTQAQFEHVTQQARDVHQFLAWQEQQRQTLVLTRLTVVASFGLAAALIGSYLAVDWGKVLGWAASSHTEMARALGVSGLVVLLTLVGMIVVVRKSTRLAKLLDAIAGSSPPRGRHGLNRVSPPS